MHGKQKLPWLCAAVLAAVLAGKVQADEKYTVDYRLKNWKTVHFEDAKRAKTHFETVKKLGCEVKQENHGGHIDVTYRCPEWKTMSVKSHDEAHKWEKWLKASGFETRHKD